MCIDTSSITHYSDDLVTKSANATSWTFGACCSSKIDSSTTHIEENKYFRLYKMHFHVPIRLRFNHLVLLCTASLFLCMAKHIFHHSKSI